MVLGRIKVDNNHVLMHLTLNAKIPSGHPSATSQTHLHRSLSSTVNYLKYRQLKMGVAIALTRASRSGSSASSSLLSSMRRLSLGVPASVSQHIPTVRRPTRAFSQAILSSTIRRRLLPQTPTAAIVSQTTIASKTPAAPLGGALLQQQTRGMKVHSSIKRRCEHCKVSRATIGARSDGAQWSTQADKHLVQVVRRKGGKRHQGYRYIICPANPRHKQRQG